VKLSADSAQALRTALRGRSRAELRRLFASIRAHDDKTLLAAIIPARTKRKPAKRSGDPLVRDLERTLKPIMGPAREKADMLVEHLARKHRRKLSCEPKGLADATRLLRQKFTDDQIRTGATSLMAHLAKLYGDRETVV